MSIEVKFFASLRETLEMNSATLEDTDATTIRQAWNAVTGNADYPANTLCAINMEYAQLDDSIKAGDEVAFFPPVTGG
jgi:molybdopterin synthase sulfur carrier subunit